MSATRWVCGQRTVVEVAVNRGLIEYAAGQSLLRKWGVPMTSPSRVMKGEPLKSKQGNLL